MRMIRIRHILNTIKHHAITSSAWTNLFAILVIAIVLRIGDGAAATNYRYDQAQLSLLALDMVHTEQIPLIGIPSSAGVPNSPVTVYFLVFPYTLTSNPLFVTLFIAIWNVIGVGLLWGIAYRYFGKLVAFVAGMVYAVNPYAIYYSRSIWAQDYHTPIILAAIWFGLLGFIEGKRWAQLLCLPLLIIGFQIHFAAWTLLPIYIWFLWVGRRKLNWLILGASIILSGLTLVPYVKGILQESSGAVGRANTIMSILQNGLDFNTYPLTQFMNLATGLGIEDLVLDSHVEQISDLFRWDFLWQWFGILAWIACVVIWKNSTWRTSLTRLWVLVGIILAIFVPNWAGLGHYSHYFIPTLLWQWLGILALLGSFIIWKNLQWRTFAGLIWIWGGITVAAFIPNWTGSSIYHHYFVPTIPALALLTALGAVGIAHEIKNILNNRNVLTLWYGVIAVAIISQAGWVLGSYHFALNTFTVSKYGEETETPLSYIMDVYEELQSFDDVIIYGSKIAESSAYIWDPILYETASCVRDLQIKNGAIDVLPQNPFAVVAAPSIRRDIQIPQRYQNDDPIEINLRPNEPPYTIYAFEEAPAWTETPITAIESLAFENHILLSGYYLIEETLQLRWQILDAPGNDYQYFVHFLDVDGERINQLDETFYSGRFWCKGDTLITTVSIPLLENVDTLRIGMYILNDDNSFTNQSLIDETGNSISPWLDIELIQDNNSP